MSVTLNTQLEELMFSSQIIYTWRRLRHQSKLYGVRLAQVFPTSTSRRATTTRPSCRSSRAGPRFSRPHTSRIKGISLSTMRIKPSIIYKEKTSNSSILLLTPAPSLAQPLAGRICHVATEKQAKHTFTCSPSPPLPFRCKGIAAYPHARPRRVAFGNY